MNQPTTDRKLISKLMFKLLPIQVLLCMIGAVNGIISSLFAGNFVGKQAMSAVGVYSPILLFIGAVSTMLISGSSILCGKYMGKNQVERTQDIFSMANFISILVSGLMIAALVIIALFDLTGFLTKDPEIRPILNSYMLGQAIGVLPMMLGNQFAAFLSLENKIRQTTSAGVIYIVANTLLNYLFVQVLHLEAFGLALASSLGQWIFLLCEARCFFMKDTRLRLTIKRIRWRDAGDIVRIGAPGAIGNGYQTVRGIIVNTLIGQFVGSVGISAFTAANTLLSFAWTVPGGMLAVSRMLISISVGEEDRQTLTDVMRNMFYRFLPLMCLISALIIVFAEPLTRLYYRDPADPVYMMTVWGFRLLPLCMPLSVIAMHFSCYGQASGKQVLVHIQSALDGFISVCLFTALLIPSLGIKSVYIANILNGVVSLLVFFIYAYIKNRRVPGNMDELMVIPADFGVPPSERMDLSLRSMEEVINISHQVQSFCRQKDIDERRAYFAGLFVEEMAGNIVSHGFTKDSRKHSVDVRVVHRDGGLILRLKDDCIAFDPAARQRIVDPEDGLKNVGIRIVYTFAKEITYQNMLGLNVLTIRI